MMKKKDSIAGDGKKVLVIITTWLNYGGAETQIFRISQSLKRRGWKVFIISMRKPEAYINELRMVGVEVFSLEMHPGFPDPRALLRCILLLRRIRPTVVLSFMFHANLLARLSAKVARVPVSISSIRNENFGGPWRDKLMATTDSLCTLTTTNSHRAARHLIDRGVTPAKRMYVVPNGLQTELYHAKRVDQTHVHAEFNLPKGTFLWLAVGRLEEQKDYPTLLQAIASLPETSQPMCLVIAGQGNLLNELKILTDKLRIQHQVKFIGVRTDIPELMEAADAFVLSSAWEGLPNVVIEAHAAALPVVSTDVGGVREIVEHNVSGIVVPPRNPHALASAMLDLMNLQPLERQRMGQNGRSHIESKFSLESVVDQWEKLFLDLMLWDEKRL